MCVEAFEKGEAVVIFMLAERLDVRFMTLIVF
jgi:hypothetical protein